MSTGYAIAMCCELGCPNWIRLSDWRHVRNFQDRWRCTDHEGDDE